MSVEKMEMVNIIGYLDELDKVSMEIVKNGSIHIVNALNEINQNGFTVITPEQNTNMLTDICFIKPYRKNTDYADCFNNLNKLMDIFKISKCTRKKYILEEFKIDRMAVEVDKVYKAVLDYVTKLDKGRDELNRILSFMEYMKSIRGLKFDINELKQLNYFDFKIGKLSKENYNKLNANIENISAIVYRISSVPGGYVVISITPKALGSEAERIFKSLNFEDISIPYGLGGTPENVYTVLSQKAADKKKEIEVYEEGILKLKAKYSSFVDESYTRSRLYEKAQKINSEVACTNEFFYLAGWVPVSGKQRLKEQLSAFGSRLIIDFKKQSEVSTGITPPTKLRNNWFSKPFEALVRMYGIPSYNEKDPTLFVAISYMIMFGCMFGDVGQGFVFLAAGIILEYKMRHPNLGGILARLGVSSMFFGVMFGSVFGNEEIIKPVLIRPMDNINVILISGIVLGVLFTSVGFIFSLINAVKRRDIEDGVFGKNGVSGLLFYWIVLFTAIEVYKNGWTNMPANLIIVVLCLLLGLMVFKQPFANLVLGNRPLYNESVQDYYIESGFGVIETLLSMLSNTISFIRVGAFALNHVGLFVAFATIAKMMKTGVGSTAMLVLGNIIIIGLEGLIVFIQGLRLEYYELFSKYYNGDGIEYNPVTLHYSHESKSDTITVAKNEYSNVQVLNN